MPTDPPLDIQALESIAEQLKRIADALKIKWGIEEI